MFHIRLVLVILLISATQTRISGQEEIPGRKQQVMEDRLEYIRIFHDSIKGTDRVLVNGEVYYPHQQGAVNHPFFGSESWHQGNVTVKGEVYPDCLVRYDLFTDRLVYLHISDGAHMLSLNRSDVDGFMIDRSEFLFLSGEHLPENLKMEEGYYERIIVGNISLLVRWSKRRIRNDGFRGDEFRLNRELYLQSGTEFIELKNDKSLRMALEPYEKETGRFMREQNIHVKTDTPVQIARVLRYYEQIKNQEK